MPVNILRMIARMRIYLLSTIIASLAFSPLYSGTAWGDDNLEDILSGFDEPPPAEEPEDTDITDDMSDVLDGFDEIQGTATDGPEASSPIMPPWLEPFGSISIMGTWNFAHDAPAAGDADYRDLSMLRTTVALGADIDIGVWRARISGHGFYDAAYSIEGSEQYSDTLLDDYEQELEFDEVYIEGSLSNNIDIKIGRQVVVWGKADNLRVTDILNPLDNRFLGLVDIKYKRLPVTMSKFDYYTGPWNLSGIVINEVRFSKDPVYNSDFYPGDSPAVTEIEPTSFSLDTQQYAVAINGIFNGWDLSFYQAWVYDSRAHLTEEDGTYVREHNRVSMTGMTGNIGFGNWLFKGEGAWWNGLEYGAVPDETFNRIDLMAGVEYTGFSETMISVEFVNRHIGNFDKLLETAPDYTEENIQQTALMISRDFFNDTTQVKLLCTLFGNLGEGGAFERLQVEHDLNDHVTLTGGVIVYQSGDMMAFSDIGDNDRIFLEYLYSF